MMRNRLFWVVVCICSLLVFFVCGCGEPKQETVKVAPEPIEPEVEIVEEEPAPPIIEPQEPPEPVESGANLVLRFSPGDITTYFVRTVDTQQVKWEGSVPENSNFKDGQNNNKVEMRFTQEIIGVDESGALAKITIKGLKYQSMVRNRKIVDYDSTNRATGNVMDFLIGRSYTITISPNGDVDVIDTSELLADLSEKSLRFRLGNNLIKPDVIKRRHGLLILPDVDQNPIEKDGQWSQTKTFSFGLMGTNAYERKYTLKDIQQEEGAKIGTVSMKAIPSAEIQTPNQAQGMAEMFDTQELYVGELKFDLDEGNVKEYVERLNIQWTAVMPTSNRQQEQPPVLKMGADRSYYLQKVD
ncbi:MAG: hypothetical protein ACYTFE_02415 [Planctomycetota bacterium]